MVLDPNNVSLYTLVHDWWGVAAFVLAGYKFWDYIKSFKTDIQTFKEDVQGDLKATKDEMLTNTSAIKTGLEHQTVSIVNEVERVTSGFSCYHDTHAVFAVEARRITLILTSTSKI